MANWDRTLIGSNPTVMLRIELWEESYNHAANTSYVRYRLSFLTSNGSRTGIWDYWLNINGGRVATGSTGNSHSGWQTYVDSGYTHNHDANGYATASAQGWGDVYFGSGDTGGSIGLTRLSAPPVISSQTVDTIKSKTVRLGGEISSVGRGTSAAMRMYYRKTGDSSWMQTSDQNDVAGYNYWTVSGLKPNTNYQYFMRVWNNNGDTADGGTQTFKTKVESGMILFFA